MKTPEGRSDGRVLDPFFDALEHHWHELPKTRQEGLGVEVRMRAESLLRLSGPWSLYRLRESLRGCIAKTPQQERLFEQAFAEVFGHPDREELEAEYTGRRLDQLLQEWQKPDQ